MKDQELRERFDKIDARFEKTDDQFEKIDARFEKIDARFEKIDARFEQMERRFEQMDRRFEQMDHRFEQMDRRFEQVLRVIVEVNAETRRILTHALLDTREELTARIDAVDQKLDAFRDETHSNFDQVFVRSDRLETEYYAISAGLQRVEKRFSEDA